MNQIIKEYLIIGPSHDHCFGGWGGIEGVVGFKPEKAIYIVDSFKGGELGERGWKRGTMVKNMDALCFQICWIFEQSPPSGFIGLNFRVPAKWFWR